MHCHPPLEPPACVREPGGSVNSRALCQRPSSRGSITSSPSHASLRVTPISQELLWRRVGMAGALGGRGTRHPSGARYMCWCIHHPRLLWDMCHLLPHSPASPDAITVLWTVLTQEGCLDVQPLPFSRAFPLSPPSQDTGPWHTGSVPAPLVLPSISCPFCAPASPRDTGSWVAHSGQGQAEP